MEVGWFRFRGSYAIVVLFFAGGRLTFSFLAIQVFVLSPSFSLRPRIIWCLFSSPVVLFPISPLSGRAQLLRGQTCSYPSVGTFAPCRLFFFLCFSRGSVTGRDEAFFFMFRRGVIPCFQQTPPPPSAFIGLSRGVIVVFLLSH